MQVYKSSIIRKIIFLIILLICSFPLTFIVKYIEDFGVNTINLLSYFSSGKSLFIPYLPELSIISFNFNYEIIFNLTIGNIIDLFILCNIICYANSFFYHLFSHVNEEYYFENHSSLILCEYISPHNKSKSFEPIFENDIIFNLNQQKLSDSTLWKNGYEISNLNYWNLLKNRKLEKFSSFKLSFSRNSNLSFLSIIAICKKNLLLTQNEYIVCNLTKSSIIFYHHKEFFENFNEKTSFSSNPVNSNQIHCINNLIIQKRGDI